MSRPPQLLIRPPHLLIRLYHTSLLDHHTSSLLDYTTPPYFCCLPQCWPPCRSWPSAAWMPCCCPQSWCPCCTWHPWRPSRTPPRGSPRPCSPAGGQHSGHWVNFYFLFLYIAYIWGPVSPLLGFNSTVFVATASTSSPWMVTHPNANRGPYCLTSVFLRPRPTYTVSVV